MPSIMKGLAAVVITYTPWPRPERANRLVRSHGQVQTSQRQRTCPGLAGRSGRDIRRLLPTDSAKNAPLGYEAQVLRGRIDPMSRSMWPLRHSVLLLLPFSSSTYSRPDPQCECGRDAPPIAYATASASNMYSTKARPDSSGASCRTRSVRNQDVDETEQPVDDKNSDTENQGRERLDRRPGKRKQALFDKSEPDDCNSGHCQQALLYRAQVPHSHVHLSRNESPLSLLEAG
jgi:hypothetical protein